MRIPGSKLLAQAIDPLRHTLHPGGIVLGYHRIADDTWDPLGLCVSPVNFRQQLEVLRDRYMLIPLRTFVDKLASGEQMAEFATLTFDDGYRDFIDKAMPELQRFGIPATVFISTGFSGGTFWWTKVAQVLNPADSRQSSLQVCINGSEQERVFNGLDDHRRAAAAARDLCRELSLLSVEAREEVMHRFVDSEPAESAGSVPARAMTPEEIRILSKNSGIEIGCHGVSHARLGQLTAPDQAREICESKKHLDAICGPDRVRGFSYPHGSTFEEGRQLLMGCGYAYACTSRPGVARARSDVYCLPRVWPRNEGNWKFRRWLFLWRGMRR